MDSSDASWPLKIDMTERPATPYRPLSNILDRLLEEAMANGSPSFRDLAKAAALDPACDFVGASLRDFDFRDENLRGFNFSNADLTGADFRRANVKGVRFKGAILDGAIGLPVDVQQRHEAGVIFISYRRLDNEPPPDGPNAGDPRYGFVNYLLRQVKYDLLQMGVPDAILWQDRSQIAPADDFNEEIENALQTCDLFLAILSRNCLKSPWFTRELDTLGTLAEESRIIRADKDKIPEHVVPEPLRNIEAVYFYREDQFGDHIDDYFWRGRVRFPDEYEAATKRLAQGIYKRLEKLGFLNPEHEPKPRELQKAPSNGRVVFVAVPAGDMDPSYRSLVTQLQGRGYRVTPDPGKDLGMHGDEVRSRVIEALSESEVSIHLLGMRSGGRPDGLDMDLVPMQLAAAAEEARRRPGFKRMIWAPDVLPGASAESGAARRDPFEVLGRFGYQQLEADQIVGDTASRFNDFVLQHLAEGHPGPRDGREDRKEIRRLRPGIAKPPRRSRRN
jgi:uncharacterized protein YjbI with pentapeptide repeats